MTDYGKKQNTVGEKGAGEESTGEESTGEESTGEESTREESTGEESTKVNTNVVNEDKPNISNTQTNKFLMVMKYIFSHECEMCRCSCIALGCMITSVLIVLALMGIGYAVKLLLHISSDLFPYGTCDLQIDYVGWASCFLCGLIYATGISTVIAIMFFLILVVRRCHTDAKKFKIYVNELGKQPTSPVYSTSVSKNVQMEEVITKDL